MRLLLFLALITQAFAAGKLTKHQFSDSKIFPGTYRDYWVYVPAEYDAAKPAALMIFQDGAGFVSKPGKEGYVPDAFDTLIASGDMPVTIGLFINPGVVPAPAGNKEAQPRFNRSFEYDGMGPNYANFLIEEMIPLLKDYNLSTNPDDRALCGGSSGAIAAFTAAWERPDHFRRVYSMIGTYVGLRGGNDYPALIRKTEPKPLRIFLQDGKNDLNIYGGDWWMANQTMQRALEFSGYEHTHRWDEGSHSRKEGNKILLEALTWLWKDHGKTPVSVHLDKCKSRAAEYLIPGEDWQLVSLGHNWAEGLAVTADGTLYFTDVPDSELYKITPDGKETLFAKDTARANGIALGPDGKTLYTAGHDIREYKLQTGEFETIYENAFANDIVVSASNIIYYTSPKNKKIGSISSTTASFQELPFQGPNGIGLSADQSQLLVCHFDGPFIHSYTLHAGKPSHKQPYFYAQRPTTDGRCALDGQFATTSGHLLVGTEAGLQIFDQPGRVQLVLPKPRNQDGRINYCYLHQNTLYIATRHRIYKRQIKLTGAPAWQPPVKVPKPKL
ncbi:MAG: sugar lactone lactonase YvrE/enterochelin esterase-like enzyme [Akkermansiaceae bacterium]|jgi:sugar lactone lactonase YvrE/enterochelin esterase-like enzyme